MSGHIHPESGETRGTWEYTEGIGGDYYRFDWLNGSMEGPDGGFLKLTAEAGTEFDWAFRFILRPDPANPTMDPNGPVVNIGCDNKYVTQIPFPQPPTE